MIGIAVTTSGTMAGTLGEAPDEDEELLDDERAPPPPEPLSRELIDAVEDVMAVARTAPKPVDSETVAKRLSSHSEI